MPSAYGEGEGLTRKEALYSDKNITDLIIAVAR